MNSHFIDRVRNLSDQVRLATVDASHHDSNEEYAEALKYLLEEMEKRLDTLRAEIEFAPYSTIL